MQHARDDHPVGRQRAGNAPGHGGPPAAAGGRAPRGRRSWSSTRGARVTAQQDRHLVAALPPRHRRRADAGRAPRAADGGLRRPRLHRGPRDGLRAAGAYVLGLDGGEPRTPEWAEALCGVPAEEIVRFARAYAAAKPAMLLPGYSIQRVFAGEEPYRLTVALQLATGNFGVLGGSTGSLNNRCPARGGQAAVADRSPTQPIVPIRALAGRHPGRAARAATRRTSMPSTASAATSSTRAATSPRTSRPSRRWISPSATNSS